MVPPIGMPEQHGAEQAPAAGDVEPARQLLLTPEGAEDGRAQSGVDRPEQDGHDAEGGVPVPVGHGPRLVALPQPGLPLVRLGVAGDVGLGRGVGQQDDGGPLQPLAPTAVVAAPVLVGGGVEIGGGLRRPLEDDPGRAPGVAGRRGAQRGIEQAIDDAGVHRLGGEAAHHGAPPDGLVELHGAAVSHQGGEGPAGQGIVDPAGSVLRFETGRLAGVTRRYAWPLPEIF